MMITSTTVNGMGRTEQAAPPFYPQDAVRAAGCYAIPRRFLYGTAAEINFWDVIYYRAREGGGAFDTSTEELVERMGLSRQMIGQLRREAVERGELIQDESWASGRRFVLRVPGFDRLTKGIIWKPLGYVRNGWHRVVTPAIPKRVLNLYLQQPRQSVYQLDVAYIAARCQRHFLGGNRPPQEPLNSADVGRALRLLVQLGLLAPEEKGLRIEWGAFQQPAPASAPSFDAPDPRQHPLFGQTAASNPALAERALELVEIGHYDLDEHWAEILRDLAYVRDDDYATLKAKVYRHRHRPPGPNRWRDTWRAFQRELKRRSAEIRSPKYVLNLGEAMSAACVLALDLAQKQAQAVRVVCRIEWPWYLEQGAVKLELESGDAVLLAREVSAGEAEVRCALLPDQWLGLTAPLVLRARCVQPLPGLRVEAWLEARLQR